MYVYTYIKEFVYVFTDLKRDVKGSSVRSTQTCV